MLEQNISVLWEEMGTVFASNSNHGISTATRGLPERHAVYACTVSVCVCVYVCVSMFVCFCHMCLCIVYLHMKSICECVCACSCL